MSTPPKLQENPVDQDLSEINLSEDQNSIEQLTISVQTLLNEVKKLKEQNQILIENRENVEDRLIRQEREMDAYLNIQTDCSQKIQQIKLDSQSQLIKQTERAQQPEPSVILEQNQIQEQSQNNQQGCQMEIEKVSKIYQNTKKSRKCYFCKKKGHQYKQCSNFYVFNKEFNQRVNRLTERIYITEKVTRQMDER